MYSDHAFPGSSSHSGAELMEIAAAMGVNFSAQQHPQQLSLQQQMALLQQLLACQGNTYQWRLIAITRQATL